MKRGIRQASTKAGKGVPTGRPASKKVEFKPAKTSPAAPSSSKILREVSAKRTGVAEKTASSAPQPRPFPTPNKPGRVRVQQAPPIQAVPEPAPPVKEIPGPHLGGPLPKKYKPAARRVTTILVGVPIIIVFGIELWRRCTCIAMSRQVFLELGADAVHRQWQADPPQIRL